MNRLESPLAVTGIVLVTVLLNALVLLGFSEALDGFTLDGTGAAIGTAIGLGLVNGALFYIASRMRLQWGVLTIGAFLFGINVAAILVAGLLIPDTEAIIAVAYTGGGMALTTGLLLWLFSIGEEGQGQTSPSNRSSRPRGPRHPA
jgi:uncharacterized membrane protein YvlD (DUF360 family)